MSKRDRMRFDSPDKMIQAAHDKYDAGTAAVVEGSVSRVKHYNATSRTTGVSAKGIGVIPAARTKRSRAAASRRGRSYHGSR